MKIFTTKVSAIILSTLIICNNYPATSNNSLFFSPIYAATILHDDIQELNDSLDRFLSQMDRTKKKSFKIIEEPLNDANEDAYHQLHHFINKNGDYINSLPTPHNKVKGQPPQEMNNKHLISYIIARLNILMNNKQKDKEARKMYKLRIGLSAFNARLSEAIPSDKKNDVIHQILFNNTEDTDSSTIFENASQFDGETYLDSEYDSLEDLEDLEDDEPIEAPNDNSTILSSSNNDYNHLTPRFHSIIHKTRTLVFPQISRKVREDKHPQSIVGASSDNYIQRYELETKYLYSTATIPQTNGKSKCNTHGLLINLKRQISNTLTIGGFYSPTVTRLCPMNCVN